MGPTARPDARTEVIFAQMGTLMRKWNEETGLSGLPDHLQTFYKKNPEALEVDLSVRKEIFLKMMADRKKFKKKFILANAYSDAMGAVSPPRIDKPPEESDFSKGGRFSGSTTPLKMKDPKKTSKLIKKMAHEFGATLVGNAKLNPDWVYRYPMKGRGFDPNKPIEVPKHWEYAVVVGTPMSWYSMYAVPITE